MSRRCWEHMFDELEIPIFPSYPKWLLTQNPILYAMPDSYRDLGSRPNQWNFPASDYHRQQYWMPQSLVFPTQDPFSCMRKNDKRWHPMKSHHFQRDKRWYGEKNINQPRYEREDCFRPDRGKRYDIPPRFEKRVHSNWDSGNLPSQYHNLHYDERNLSRLSIKSSSVDLCTEDFMIEQHIKSLKQALDDRNLSSEYIPLQENFTHHGTGENKKRTGPGGDMNYSDSQDTKWKQQDIELSNTGLSDCLTRDSTSFCSSYESWYCPQEQQQIVDMLKEVNLRHDRQLRRDMMDFPEEAVLSNNDSTNSEYFSKSSSFEDDEETINIILSCGDAVKIPEEVNYEEELKSGYLEKSSSHFLEEFQSIFTGSPEKQIFNSITKETLRKNIDVPEGYIEDSKIITDEDKEAVKSVLNFEDFDEAFSQGSLEKFSEPIFSSSKEIIQKVNFENNGTEHVFCHNEKLIYKETVGGSELNLLLNTENISDDANINMFKESSSSHFTKPDKGSVLSSCPDKTIITAALHSQLKSPVKIPKIKELQMNVLDYKNIAENQINIKKEILFNNDLTKSKSEKISETNSNENHILKVVNHEFYQSEGNKKMTKGNKSNIQNYRIKLKQENYSTDSTSCHETNILDEHGHCYSSEILTKSNSSFSEPFLGLSNDNAKYRRISVSEIFQIPNAMPENILETLKERQNEMKKIFNKNNSSKPMSPSEHLKLILGIGTQNEKHEKEGNLKNLNCVKLNELSKKVGSTRSFNKSASGMNDSHSQVTECLVSISGERKPEKVKNESFDSKILSHKHEISTHQSISDRQTATDKHYKKFQKEIKAYPKANLTAGFTKDSTKINGINSSEKALTNKVQTKVISYYQNFSSKASSKPYNDKKFINSPRKGDSGNTKYSQMDEDVFHEETNKWNSYKKRTSAHKEHELGDKNKKVTKESEKNQLKKNCESATEENIKKCSSKTTLDVKNESTDNGKSPLPGSPKSPRAKRKIRNKNKKEKLKSENNVNHNEKDKALNSSDTSKNQSKNITTKDPDRSKPLNIKNDLKSENLTRKKKSCEMKNIETIKHKAMKDQGGQFLENQNRNTEKVLPQKGTNSNGAKEKKMNKCEYRPNDIQTESCDSNKNCKFSAEDRKLPKTYEFNEEERRRLEERRCSNDRYHNSSRNEFSNRDNIMAANEREWEKEMKSHKFAFQSYENKDCYYCKISKLNKNRLKNCEEQMHKTQQQKKIYNFQNKDYTNYQNSSEDMHLFSGECNGKSTVEKENKKYLGEANESKTPMIELKESKEFKPKINEYKESVLEVNDCKESLTELNNISKVSTTEVKENGMFSTKEKINGMFITKVKKIGSSITKVKENSVSITKMNENEDSVTKDKEKEKSVTGVNKNEDFVAKENEKEKSITEVNKNERCTVKENRNKLILRVLSAKQNSSKEDIKYLLTLTQQNIFVHPIKHLISANFSPRFEIKRFLKKVANGKCFIEQFKFGNVFLCKLKGKYLKTFQKEKPALILDAQNSLNFSQSLKLMFPNFKHTTKNEKLLLSNLCAAETGRQNTYFGNCFCDLKSDALNVKIAAQEVFGNGTGLIFFYPPDILCFFEFREGIFTLRKKINTRGNYFVSNDTPKAIPFVANSFLSFTNTRK